MDFDEYTRRVIDVASIFRSIGEGVGTAASEIVSRSASPVGTLALKAADITVEFEMAAASTTKDVGAGSFGELVARGPRIGTSEQTMTAQNRASIVLKVVAVPGDPNRRLPAGWPWERWSLEAVREGAQSIDALARALAMHVLVVPTPAIPVRGGAPVESSEPPAVSPAATRWCYGYGTPWEAFRRNDLRSRS